MPNSEYKPVIGFEIHIQLATKSKMFSPAPNDPNTKEPNTNIDEIVTGQPGTMPVANKEAIRLAAMVGLALNCKVDEFSKFDRKHYFYPDLPKGYQISQYDKPISREGYLDIQVPTNNEHDSDKALSNKSAKSSTDIHKTSSLGARTKRVRITRAHLEEDAGKNLHPEGLHYSLVDYNRAGAPLLEIVTEPDIESAEEATVFLQELRNIVRYLGASDADMEKGTMRVEPNISVRRPEEIELPKYKVEVKNINSFKFAEDAINYEIARHIELLKDGITPKQVTMGWDEKKEVTVEQRSKEEAHDYRYYPDPNLPEMQFTEDYLDKLKRQMPELPAQKRERFLQEFELANATVENLINWKELSFYFEYVVSEIAEWVKQEEGLGQNELIKLAANWSLGEFSAALNQAAIEPQHSNVTPENFAELMKMIQQGKVSGSAAKKVFKVMFEKGGDPSNILDDLGLHQVSDEGEIEKIVNQVIKNNQKAVADYKAGQQKSFGFLVGQTMKELKGKGNPQIINQLLKRKLE